MARLTTAGEQTLAGKNIVSHTRLYINGQLLVGNPNSPIDNPVTGYQISRSRKLGAAKLSMTIASPDGLFSYKKQKGQGKDPLFGYGNKVKLQEGLAVNGTVEWFTRFTGIIISQVPVNIGGKPSLRVHALDNMKLLLDYLPDDLYYCPEIIRVSQPEVLQDVDGNKMHYRSTQNHVPWVDIPYPVFYKDGEKIKENYDLDLVNGEVYFAEKMQGLVEYQATRVTSTRYSIPVQIRPNPQIRRSFKLWQYDSSSGATEESLLEDKQIPSYSISGSEVIFFQDPFSDLVNSTTRTYTDKVIYITTEVPYTITADYRYYNIQTNKAEDVIRDLALRAGFTAAQISLEATGVSLKPVRFTSLTIKNGFEALQKVKQYLSPNYIVTCDVDGNLRGYYASQQVTGDYDLELIRRIQAPVSEEGLYTAVVAHGIDLNPRDLAKTAQASTLLNTGGCITVTGEAQSVLNKNVNDQISWHWVQKNDDTPPEFPIDLLKIDLAEAKKLEEINILVGDYQGGTIQQSISVQVSEDGQNWFYSDRSSRGLSGSSSQWLTVRGGELENRKIKHVKFIAEAGFNWVDAHSYSKRSGFLGLSMKVQTDNYYNWYLAIKEVQIWEENTIAVTSSLCNCFGIGNGSQTEFYIPNFPLKSGTPVTVYKDGVVVASGYSVDFATGKVTFTAAPTGVLTADYTVAAKGQSVTGESYENRYDTNVTVIDPENLSVEFRGGNQTDANRAAFDLLKKVGLKKIALKSDNYLNSYQDVKKRGEDMIGELSRLAETLDIDVVYRPDADICQTVEVADSLLGLNGLYFIEEILESKQGPKPVLNIKLSNYSALVAGT